MRPTTRAEKCKRHIVAGESSKRKNGTVFSFSGTHQNDSIKVGTKRRKRGSNQQIGSVSIANALETEKAFHSVFRVHGRGDRDRSLLFRRFGGRLDRFIAVGLRQVADHLEAAGLWPGPWSTADSSPVQVCVSGSGLCCQRLICGHEQRSKGRHNRGPYAHDGWRCLLK